MYPQEGTVGHPAFEYASFEEPSGGCIVVDPACGIVVCRRVRRREPSPDVLFYLVPCNRVSVLIIQATEVTHYGHFISLTSGRTSVQRKVSNWPDEVRTHHSLSYNHRDILLYQAIQFIQRILNVCPPQQSPEIDF